MHVNVPGDGSATTIELTATASVGRGASARGTLDGSFTGSSFALSGHATITVLGHAVGGSMKADDKGIAACGTYKKHSAGFEYSVGHGVHHLPRQQRMLGKRLLAKSKVTGS